MRERVVWSAKHGGCLMLQLKRAGVWEDWSSFYEGEYPRLDRAARATVRRSNAIRRSQHELARDMYRKIGALAAPVGHGAV